MKIDWDSAPDWASCVVQSKLTPELRYWASGWATNASLLGMGENGRCTVLAHDFDIYFSLVEWRPDEHALMAASLPSPPEDSPLDYKPLACVLDAAYSQAAYGKGKARHANGKPFINQPILALTRIYGLGYPMGQVSKKLEEAMGMLERGEFDAAMRECLGAIVYSAAACLYIEEKKNEQ